MLKAERASGTNCTEKSPDATQQNTIESASSESSYTPQVGDVVEWVEAGRKRRGMVFTDDYGTDSLITEDGPYGMCQTRWGTAFGTKTLRRIGHVDNVPNEAVNHEGAKSLYKAYLIGKKKQPTFTGTYAERQAQWVKHHGLKAGDEVMVVRKFVNDEDGYNGHSHEGKDIGITIKIYHFQGRDGIKTLDYTLSGKQWFPYFVLEPVK